MSKQSKDKYKIEVFKYFSTLVLMMLSIFFVFNYLHLQSVYNTEYIKIEKNLTRLFSMEMDRVAKYLSSQIDTTLSVSGIKDAIYYNDRERLKELSTPLFKAFKKENRLLQIMHFQDRKGSALLRVHNPDYFGDNLYSKREMIKEVIDNRKIQIGLEEGVYGYQYRVVKPIFRDNEFIGSAEIGISIDYFKDFIENYYPELSILMVIKQENLNLYKDKSKLNTFKDYYIFGDKKNLELLSNFKDVESEKNFTTFRVLGKEYLLLKSFFLDDYKHDNLIRVIIKKDISYLKREFNYILIVIILTATILYIFFFAINRLTVKYYINNIQSLNVNLREANENLEVKIAERTEEVEYQRKQTELVLSSVMLPIVITSIKSKKILYANSEASRQYGIPLNQLIGSPIEMVYSDMEDRNRLLKILSEKGSLHNHEIKLKRSNGEQFDTILSIVPISYNGENVLLSTVADITIQKKRELELKTLHRYNRDSINYASLIQDAIIPSKTVINRYFNDSFVIYEPRDTVSGDIYLIEPLRGDDEMIMFVIDCTGHGVSGAFLTMLVKAIERQIIAKILNSSDEVDTADTLHNFHIQIQSILKHTDKDSVSKLGFDGSVLYYNRKKQEVFFSGAKSDLFILREQDLDLEIIKGNKRSIGFSRKGSEKSFIKHKVQLKEGDKLYLTTDGFIDQQGGDKKHSFGKRRFKNMILENRNESFAKQKEIFLSILNKYQGNIKRNDDITFIGLNL